MFSDIPLCLLIKFSTSEELNSKTKTYISSIPEILVKNATIRKKFVELFHKIGSTPVRLEKKQNDDNIYMLIRCTTLESLDKLRKFCFSPVRKEESLSGKFKEILGGSFADEISCSLDYTKDIGEAFVRGMNILMKAGKG